MSTSTSIRRRIREMKSSGGFEAEWKIRRLVRRLGEAVLEEKRLEDDAKTKKIAGSALAGRQSVRIV